jgi:hypothetical protein
MTERDILLQGIQSVLQGNQGNEALPADAATIRDVQAVPSHMRTQDQQAALIAAQQRAMADLLKKPNSEVTAEEAADIRRACISWMRDGDGK